ncbi:dienelactone hydrolase family protein [Streptomyces sp. ID05-47C]|uniref:dienelactone hydrolase family protein n=1 Tax=Streptomyces sp. ID05-47C TaxID=3028665 RepID=UPI0029A8DE2F|nr:dienelactone hydrolase family protein [Streptomyces sp. ID05-47C]MDX3571856.1 dienelactone hydrolase family protein [Streptomyces sp. ID05-47C]
MTGGEPAGRRAFVTGTGAALLAGQAGVARAAVADGPLPGFHPALKDALTFPLAWGNSPIRDFDTWRRAARAKVEETLLVDREDATPYAPEFRRRTDGDGYTGELVTLSLTRHERVRAALLTPHGPGPFPAVLLLHDHGAKFDIGKEKLVRPWYDGARLASARTWTERYFSGRFVGDELARRGYVVLVADALGWGDRGPLAHDQQQALASNFYHLGSSLAGLMAREDARAAGFLARLERVDRRRIAAVGFSMGAFRAWQAAALTDDLAATAAVCWMTGLREMMVPGNNTLRGQSSYCMLHPGLSRHLDFPDVASIAAPRPMLFFDGGLDPLFPADGVRVAHEKLRAVWRSRHAEERLHLRTWPDLGHVFTDRMQDEVFTWLDHVL